MGEIIMKYNEFLELCESVYKNFSGDGEVQISYYADNWRSRATKIETPRLFVEWETGGYSGGNCWDSSDPQPYTSNGPPKELEILDTILEKVCPTITFLQYKNLTATLEKYDTRSVGEYYGNSTDYAYKHVDLRDLYDYLMEKEFI
jgi:hypothetical protein